MAKGEGLTDNNHAQSEADVIASEFIDYLNEFHSRGIQVDDELNVQLMKDYIEIIESKEKPEFKYPNFRSSSTGACAREHYVRLCGSDPDKRTSLPHQTRWQNIGTHIGDMIQFDLLLAEKHHTGVFKFEKIEKEIPCKYDVLPSKRSYPHFEEFSTKSREFTRDGQTFMLHGSTDGIMLYTKEDGTTLRVGLEIKSKQTSYGRTSPRSMKEAEYKHRKQTTTYSLMFDVDYWIILYVNASKKSWSESDCDIRAFGHYVTNTMKEDVLSRFAYICKCVDEKTPPPLELDNWTFNNFKNACADDLTTDEILKMIDNVQNGNYEHLPVWLQKSVEETVVSICKYKGFEV